MNLFGRALSKDKRGKHEEALQALKKATEILGSHSCDPRDPWVLSQYVTISRFLSHLGVQLGRPGIELDAVVQGLQVWDTQVAENPRLRSIPDLVEWEGWARSCVSALAPDQE